MELLRYCQRCGSHLVTQLHQGRMRPVCSSCGAVVFLDPKVVAGVIVELDGRVVMVRRSQEPGIGKWTFPAGFVDRGERVEEAAIRETEEEAGLKVTLNGLLGVYSRSGEANILVVYTGQVVGGELAAGSEAQEVGLFDPDDLPPLAFDQDRAIFAEWMQRKGRLDD